MSVVPVPSGSESRKVNWAWILVDEEAEVVGGQVSESDRDQGVAEAAPELPAVRCARH